MVVGQWGMGWGCDVSDGGARTLVYIYIIYLSGRGALRKRFIFPNCFLRVYPVRRNAHHMPLFPREQCIRRARSRFLLRWPPAGDVSGRHRRRILHSTICRPFPTGLDPDLDIRIHTHYISYLGRFKYLFIARAHTPRPIFITSRRPSGRCVISPFSRRRLKRITRPIYVPTDNQYESASRRWSNRQNHYFVIYMATRWHDATANAFTVSILRCVGHAIYLRIRRKPS